MAHLPSMVNEGLLVGILEKTNALESTALTQPEKWQDLTDDRAMQESFLSHFRKTFNISLSLTLVGSVYKEFNRWKQTEIYFVEKYNGIHEEWKARIMSSAASRAVGYYTACDPKNPTVSGFLEDATGNPIVQGADSKLTMAFLAAAHPESFNPRVDITANAPPPIRDINPEDDGATAADIYSQLVKKAED
jgi:hypothetical protein